MHWFVSPVLKPQDRCFCCHSHLCCKKMAMTRGRDNPPFWNILKYIEFKIYFLFNSTQKVSASRGQHRQQFPYTLLQTDRQRNRYDITTADFKENFQGIVLLATSHSALYILGLHCDWQCWLCFQVMLCLYIWWDKNTSVKWSQESSSW